MKAIRVWLARLLVRGTEHSLVLTSKIEEVEKKIVALHRLTYSSGHLSRAYSAGRAVRYGAQDALDALFAARGKNGLEFHDTYANPRMREVYGDPELGASRAA